MHTALRRVSSTRVVPLGWQVSTVVTDEDGGTLQFLFDRLDDFDRTISALIAGRAELLAHMTNGEVEPPEPMLHVDLALAAAPVCTESVSPR